MRRPFLLAAALLASLASAHTFRASPKLGGERLVDVKLSSSGGSVVKVAVKNVGRRRIDFLQRGTIMDDNPISKVEVKSMQGDDVRFLGVHPRISMDGNFSSESFQQLWPGQKVEYQMDMAFLYDLTNGGDYQVLAQGALPWALPGRLRVTGDTRYVSNILKINVDAKMASMAKQRWVQLDKRSSLAADCSQDAGRAQATKNALGVCSSIAYIAGEMALKGNVEQFERYFRTRDPKMRKLVSDRLHAVSNECGERSNKSRSFCQDPRKFCRSDYIAYTLGTEITNCDLYWKFPLATAQCHSVSQATTTIHEMTHVEGLFDPSTDDFPGHYGWPALSNLPPEQAIMNADNYGFYANAVYSNNPGC